MIERVKNQKTQKQMRWEIEMEELCDKGVEGTEGQIKRENELLLLSECSSVSGGKSIRGISAG